MGKEALYYRNTQGCQKGTKNALRLRKGFVGFLKKAKKEVIISVAAAP